MRLKTIRADESIKHVALIGRLDVQGVNDVQHEFLQETTMVAKATVVDLSKVTFIASLGVGMLVSVAKYLEQRGARMVLLAPSDMVRATLETSYLHDLIPIAEREESALELLR